MTRGRRFGGQLLLLPLLWLLSDYSVFTLVVAAALLVAAPVSTTVAAVLVLLVRSAEKNHPNGAPVTMVVAADNAITVAMICDGAAVAAAIAIARIFGVFVPGRPIVVIIAWIMLLAAVPALGWARTLRNVWLPQIQTGD